MPVAKFVLEVEPTLTLCCGSFWLHTALVLVGTQVKDVGLPAYRAMNSREAALPQAGLETCQPNKGCMSAKSSLALSQAARQLEEEERQRELAYHPVSLVFRNSMVEGEFLAEVSCSRSAPLLQLCLYLNLAQHFNQK